MALSQIIWPLNLPQAPLVDGYKDTPGRAVIQSEFDVGPKRQRKRASSAMRKVTATYYIKKSQLTEWEGFFEVSLGRSFWWPDPIRGEYVYARISNDPELTPRGPTWYSLSLELEVWPYITSEEMDMGNTVLGLSLDGDTEGQAGATLEYTAEATSTMIHGRIVRYEVTFNEQTFSVTETGLQGTLVNNVGTFTIQIPADAVAETEYILSVMAYDNYGGHSAAPATSTITVVAAPDTGDGETTDSTTESTESTGETA